MMHNQKLGQSFMLVEFRRQPFELPRLEDAPILFGALESQTII